MGFKSLFIKEDPVSEESQKVQLQPVTTRVATSAPVSFDNSETKKMLEKVIEDSQTGGFDYPRFRKSLEQLKTTLPDEVTRMKSTLMMMKSMGVSTSSLISSAMKSIDLLNGEKSKFEEEMNDLTNSEVVQKEQSITSIDESIKKKTEEINKLTLEIADLQKEKSTSTLGISEAKQKINTLRGTFDFTHKYMVQEIQSDVEKIKSYTGGV